MGYDPLMAWINESSDWLLSGVDAALVGGLLAWLLYQWKTNRVRISGEKLGVSAANEAILVATRGQCRERDQTVDA